MLASTKLASAYAIFALIATSANIAAQDLVIRIYSDSFAILISMLVGTVVGLVIKYALDKRYIFRFQVHNVAHNAQTFILYAIMGLVTTVIFWSFEFAFQFLYATKEMRYLGGAIGLTLGYLVKYQLDKHYVFHIEA